MPLQSIKAGSTSVIMPDIFLQDSSQSDGRGLAGLVYNTASLTCYYHRNTATASVAVSLVTMTLGTFASGGFKEVDATHMRGVYSFCPPDLAVAAGAQSVTFYFGGAANLADSPCQVTLVLLDPQSAAITLPTIPNDWIAAAGVKADAVTKIQAGLATPTNITAAIGVTVSAIGANVITAAAIADGAIDTATFAGGATIPRVTLADTLTVYTGNTPQTGDSFALANGANGFAATKADTAAIGSLATGIKAKTDNLPGAPAAVGSAMTLADGAITDAKITVPADGTGQATGVLSMIFWLYQRWYGKSVNDKVAHAILTYHADGVTLRTTQDATSSSLSDTVGKAS